MIEDLLCDTITNSKKLYIDIRSKMELNAKGFTNIASIWRMSARKQGYIMVLDFHSASFFSPALLATMGVLIEKIKSYNNQIIQKNITGKALPFKFFELSSRERFSYLSPEFDYFYIKTKDNEEQIFFENYINNDLFRNIPYPNIYDFSQLKRCIFELHENIKIHTNTIYFAVSSFFDLSTNTLTFTIANFGYSIPYKLSNFGYEFESKSDALAYALQKGHSTKTSASGGLGLYLVNEFITDIKGELHIVSDNVYFLNKNQIESYTTLTSFYPGTSITLVVSLNELKKKTTQALPSISIINLWEVL